MLWNFPEEGKEAKNTCKKNIFTLKYRDRELLFYFSSFFPFFSSQRHPRSTAALASALYNSGPATSGSFNSSGRSSNCDDGDIHSDISIEEDVIELNSKVRQLQDQVALLTENQSVNDERYSRVKADNVTLTAKIHLLEENIREIEMRGEERLGEEQRRNRDIIQRLEREKQLEIENYSIRLQVRFFWEKVWQHSFLFLLSLLFRKWQLH